MTPLTCQVLFYHSNCKTPGELHELGQRDGTLLVLD